jgi:hypothetical protein
MKCTIPMLCILAATLTSNAQDKNFDLSNYKFPDYKQHKLEFNINSSGISNKSTHVESTGQGDFSTLSSNFNSYSNFNLKYEFNRIS